MNGRLDYIDTAKGIGIILVVIYHYLLGAKYINNWISSFIIPLFFMIKGYLYTFRNDFKSMLVIYHSKSQGIDESVFCLKYHCTYLECAVL